MHRRQRLVYPSKQFWNWFCGMAFRPAVVVPLMSSISSKWFPLNISFIFGDRKNVTGCARSGEQARCSNTVICLVAKNSLTDSTVRVGSLSWCKIHALLAKHTQTIIDATQKGTAIDQQQHSCETLIYQRHQTILRLLSSAATATAWWRFRELICPIT